MLDAAGEDEEAEAIVGRRCRKVVKGNHIAHTWMCLAKINIYIFFALSLEFVTIIPCTVHWFIQLVKKKKKIDALNIFQIIFANRTNPFTAMCEDEFINCFRLQKASAHDLTQQISDQLPVATDSRGMFQYSDIFERCS